MACNQVGAVVNTKYTPEMNCRTSATGVTTAGAAQMPQTAGFRDTLNHLFQPAADRLGRGDLKKGKPSIAEQLQRADLKLRTSEYFLIQMGSTALFFLIGFLRWGIVQGVLAAVIGYLVPGMYVKYRIGRRLKAFNGQLGDTLSLLIGAQERPVEVHELLGGVVEHVLELVHQAETLPRSVFFGVQRE